VTEYIKDILNECDCEFSDLNAIAIGGGPGSYTGIRIGMSIAKGLCYGLEIPLIKVGTLKAMANGVLKKLNVEKQQENIVLIPMIDARRKEVFTACYDENLNELEGPHAKIIDGSENAFEKYAGKDVVCFGDGAEKCSAYLNHLKLKEIEMSASAKNFVELAEAQYHKNEIENLALTSASYFKEFYTLRR